MHKLAEDESCVGVVLSSAGAGSLLYVCVPKVGELILKPDAEDVVLGSSRSSGKSWLVNLITGERSDLPAAPGWSLQEDPDTKLLMAVPASDDVETVWVSESLACPLYVAAGGRLAFLRDDARRDGVVQPQWIDVESSDWQLRDIALRMGSCTAMVKLSVEIKVLTRTLNLGQGQGYIVDFLVVVSRPHISTIPERTAVSQVSSIDHVL
jgi:hypothetical protein